MKHIEISGYLYEAVDLNHVYDELKTAIQHIQAAKNTIQDKNQLRSLKAVQKKIKKTFDKIKAIEEGNPYTSWREIRAAQDNMTDEQKIEMLRKMDEELGASNRASDGLQGDSRPRV